ncbi:MAG TPA: polyphosphate kinase 1 [Candidatus Polarisedimenticolaceae bacterium]|nr:polyphosphate kinase 1 [Candidatus Polarisedimenticolaceae bacterium]
MAEIDDQTRRAAADLDLDSPQLYVNRELSLLQFQRRVLEEAQDPSVPLLERVRFLSILGSNMDEFFMIRMAGLKQQVAAGVVESGPDGMTPSEQLAAARALANEIKTEARSVWRQQLVPLLAKEGIRVLAYDEIPIEARLRLRTYFEESVFPVLTPLAVDPSRPFPHISNLSVNLAVVVRDVAGREQFARVKVPATLSQLVPIPGLGTAADSWFVSLEQLIAANLDALFPGMQILDVHAFRVTRNADLVIQELEAGDLLETIEESVRQRQFGFVTRITVAPTMPLRILDDLLVNLEADHADVELADGPLALIALGGLFNLDRPDLKEPPFQPALPRSFEGSHADPFAVVRQGDVLLHHPYDSFTPVIHFLRAAAADPDVLAIKMTLYRIGRNAPVVDALLAAREEGKQVAVLVELKARFDEARNIEWARALEHEGVHVVYGLLGLKTHAKIALVIRREGDRIRRYTHLSTGNYNAVTAQQYTDLGLITCDDAIGADASDLFNYLTGYSAKIDYHKLAVAPIGLRQTLERLIEREIEHQAAGRQGHIIMKMNALADRRMIRLLYQASQAGVKVDLVVRGICCLKPGVPGVSDNIRVVSILGRFLEHSRVFYFRNGGDEDVYLGSADLMPRNLNGRVEAMFPVADPRLVNVLREEILAAYLADNVKARAMNADGTYTRIAPSQDAPRLSAQAWFLKARAVARRA